MTLESLESRLAKLKDLVERKKAEVKKVPAPSRQLKLELWPEEVRGVPNAILRGALFGVVQKRKVHKRRTLIAAVDGYEIRFKGEAFNQTDLDVLEGMLHVAMPHPLGKKVEFHVHSFLKALGRKTSGEQHEQFKEQVARLIGGVVEITDLKKRKTFVGTLVQKAYRDEDSGRYVVIAARVVHGQLAPFLFCLCDLHGWHGALVGVELEPFAKGFHQSGLTRPIAEGCAFKDGRIAGAQLGPVRGHRSKSSMFTPCSRARFTRYCRRSRLAFSCAWRVPSSSRSAW